MALQWFIDSLLPIPNGADGTGLQHGHELSEVQERALRIRRAMARMGPHLSSGGRKVQQDQAALVARAWREEWEVLDVQIDEVEEALRAAEEPERAPSDLFTTLLPNIVSLAEEPEQGSRVAGSAKRRGWSLQDTAIDLVMTSLDALSILVEGNVLRRKAALGHITVELVHDGFAEALSDWSEEARYQQIEAAISILLVGGMDVDAQDQAGRVH
jgi:hypothetical protein